MPVLPVKREAGRGLLKVDGQGEVDGVTGGVERKKLEKRAFRGDCPSIIHQSSCRKNFSRFKVRFKVRLV